MLEREWLDIGYKNGVIDIPTEAEISFLEAYRMWFKMKILTIKKQSVDRIECVYNRYIKHSDFECKNISTLIEKDILDFLLDSVYSKNITTKKEFDRLYQIVKGVIVYMRDTGQGYVKLIDWEAVKRMIPHEKLTPKRKCEYAVSSVDVAYLIDKVVVDKIYIQKQSACLCLCMNFFLGLRIGELAGLKFSDFDLRNNVLHVKRTESKFFERDEDGNRTGTMQYFTSDSLKTINSYRTIPLVPEVKFFYMEIKAHHTAMKYESEYLAFDGTQTVLIRSLDRTLRRLCNLCGVRYFNSHEIRKTFATMLHYNNVPTKVISGLMGHSEMSTTERCYILTYADEYKQVLGYMSDALKYEKKDSHNGLSV